MYTSIARIIGHFGIPTADSGTLPPITTNFLKFIYLKEIERKWERASEGVCK